LAAQETRSVREKGQALQTSDSRHWPHQHVPIYMPLLLIWLCQYSW